ncbi:protein Tob2-like [Anopheles bellator]|uniref:protein Tob2-like n=1 Tax=Anopheles bellator TaxID=139047 RepID=UPI00264711D1|nr:protein Tob2-like [Anopheles bellator]XP_058058665.1 protein Tob2-like [Anopheles bellator]
MRIEVNSAADFLMNLLRVRKANQLSENQLQHFKGSLEQILTRHFQRHWYPDVPTKGSGFRCLRINGKMDPIIEKAGHAVGLNAVILRKLLPLELTVWIDPDEVSYRIGENGTICVLYDIAQSRASPSSDLDSTGSSTGMSPCDEFIMERVGRLDLSLSSVDSGNGSSSSSNGAAMADYLEHTNASSNGKSQHHQQQQQHHNNKYNHNQSNNHHHHHYAKQRHSNSMSSSSSGQNSPPLSPPYGAAANTGYLNYQHLARYQQQQQQPQHGNNFYPSAATVHQPQQYFHWDNQFVNNKVRTQC